MSSFVVVDLEMCPVAKIEKNAAFSWGCELIQIGAVRLDDSLEIVDSFMTYVYPEYGQVDSYIQQLTGITPEDTRNAPGAGEALEAFAAWLPEDAVLVSWSRSDEIQIRKEIELKHLSVPGLERRMEGWIDCQETFSRKMNNPRSYKLSEALNITGIDTSELLAGEHNAIADAWNTASLFAKMEREPELKLSHYLHREGTMKKGTYTPFAGLMDLLKQDA